jgi:undecaprenyl diphosphate synthase
MHYRSIGTFHVGVIMDGNGRWAEARGLSRITGHAEGARRVTEIVRACPGLGVTHLTLFAFSTENWRRPLAEIDGLMRIFRQYIRNKMVDLRAHDVRVRFLGMRERVPPRLRGLMHELEERTRDCQGLNLSIAIDYGGRDELTRAVRAIAGRVAAGEVAPEAISEAVLGQALDTRDLPDPDFIIRTSGERRVSNFLLWQGAYAEYDFPAIAWPDFTVARFAETLSGFRARERRFGGTAMPRTLVAADL